MTLIESALLKVEGKYPTITNKPLWKLVSYNELTGRYDDVVISLYPRDIVSSSLNVKQNDVGETVISLRSIEMYNTIVDLFKTHTLLFVRQTEIPQWFVLDSASASKNQDGDSGVEEWSYEFNLLDGVSLLANVLLVNNKYADVPQEPPEGYELPSNYLKFSLGTGTEIRHSEIISQMISRPLYDGIAISVATPLQRDEFKFVGLQQPTEETPSNPYYPTPITSWVNTECGDTTVLDKISELAWPVPILGEFIDGRPHYKCFTSPNKIVIDQKMTNSVMASYTAGFEHSEDQVVYGFSSTYPAINVFKYRTVSPTPYLKTSSLSQETGEGLSYIEGRDQIAKLCTDKRTLADIQKFIDTQLTTMLKPFNEFILGDVIQIEIDDIEGFGVIDLMVVEIGEAIEEDAITYTLTLEEMEE